MRKPFEIPPHLVKQAQLFAPGRSDLDALCHVLEDYPRLVGEIRKLRGQLQDFTRESADFDQRLAQLQVLCRQIIDL